MIQTANIRERLNRYCWLLCLLFGVCAAAGPASAVTITVGAETGQATVPTSVASKAGVLLGYYPDGKPPLSMLEAVRPGLMRVGDWRLYQRARDVDASYEMVLSELWGYPQNNYNGAGMPPYDDLDRWGEVVRASAKQGVGKVKIRWDVWNESNWPPFFVGSKEQFFAVYLRAYRVLRQELGPAAVVGGPSLAHLDLGFMRAFLDFCLLNRCEINFLSWHEGTAPPEDPAIIARHALQVRSLAARPEYRAVAVRQIEINEVVSPQDQFLPASALVDLVELEQGAVDLGARACWNNKAAQNQCFNNSLDGLTSPETGQPLANWWVYKYYADSLRARLPSRTDDPRVVSVASRPDPKTTEVMIGYYEANANADRPASIVFAGAQAAKSPADVDIRVIPVGGETPLTHLASIAHFAADATQPIRLPALRCNQVLIVTITHR